jgi:hypothetical protein
MTKIHSEDATILDAYDADEAQALRDRDLSPQDLIETIDVEPKEIEANNYGDQDVVWKDVTVVALRKADVEPTHEGGIDTEIRPVEHEDALLVVSGPEAMICTASKMHMIDTNHIVEVKE